MLMVISDCALVFICGRRKSLCLRKNCFHFGKACPVESNPDGGTRSVFLAAGLLCVLCGGEKRSDGIMSW